MKKGKAADAAGSPKKRATFSLASPQAMEVSVAGTFNEWNTARDPMKRKGDGQWVLVKYLPPGAHECRFVFDGVRTTDPASVDRRPNIYGGENSVIEL